MAQNDDNDRLVTLFSMKIMKKVAAATAILLMLVFFLAFIRHGRGITNTILSDYFFTVGIVLSIAGALMRTAAWIIHKRFVLKPGEDNENDVIKARIVLKLFSKIFAFVGFVNIIVSLIFLVLYYYE